MIKNERHRPLFLVAVYLDPLILGVDQQTLARVLHFCLALAFQTRMG